MELDKSLVTWDAGGERERGEGSKEGNEQEAAGIERRVLCALAQALWLYRHRIFKIEHQKMLTMTIHLSVVGVPVAKLRLCRCCYGRVQSEGHRDHNTRVLVL